MDRRPLLRRDSVKLDPSAIVILFVRCQKRVALIRPWQDPGKTLKSRIDPGKSSVWEIYDTHVYKQWSIDYTLLPLPQTLDELLVF